MKNWVVAVVSGACGFGAGMFVGATESRKEVKRLKEEMEEIEKFYDEELTTLENKIEELATKMKSKSEKVVRLKLDGDDAYIADDDEYDFDEEVKDDVPVYNDILEKATKGEVPYKQNSKIHPMDCDEALELVAKSNGAIKLREVCLFSCGTLTYGDKETKIPDARALLDGKRYDMLRKAEEGDEEPEFPYFLYNENEKTVFEIIRDYGTHEEYMKTV